jgi:hypothetical protein
MYPEKTKKKTETRIEVVPMRNKHKITRLAASSFFSGKTIADSYDKHEITAITLIIDKNTWKRPKSAGV